MSTPHQSSNMIGAVNEVLILRRRRTELSLYECFMQTLFMENLPRTVQRAFEKLEGKTEQDTTVGEILRYFCSSY